MYGMELSLAQDCHRRYSQNRMRMLRSASGNLKTRFRKSAMVKATKGKARGPLKAAVAKKSAKKAPRNSPAAKHGEFELHLAEIYAAILKRRAQGSRSTRKASVNAKPPQRPAILHPSFVQIMSLIGKSERSGGVKKMLSVLGIKSPLKRPAIGAFPQIDVYVKYHPLQFRFCPASDDQIENGAIEGEFILKTVFLFPCSFGDLKRNDETLPFGLSWELARSQVRKLFGRPEWTTRLFNNDRWIIDGFRVLVCFSDDETSVQQIAISLDA